MNNILLTPVRHIIELLVAGKYADIEKRTRGVRLSGDQISKAIFDYGRKLTLPPDHAYELLDVIEVRNATPRRWSITMPLWTEEEGRSDLSIELTLIEGKDETEVELDDIHVL